jgi:hypothetical protein
MLLRDLQVRTVSFSASDRPAHTSSASRSDYFRDYDQRRASDPLRRQQIRSAMMRYRQRKQGPK